MRLITRLFLTLILTALCLVPRTHAQEGPEGGQITQLALLSDTTAVEAGKPFYVGFHFTIIEKWHLYWRFPGSAGYPLTIKEWKLPPGWTAEPIDFPLPEKVVDAYNQTLFAYEHEVLFPVKITPPK